MRRPFAFLLPLFTILTLHTTAQNKDNTAKMPVQMVIPPSAKLSMISSDLKFSIFEGKGKERKLASSVIDSVWMNYSSIIEYNNPNSICASFGPGDIPAEIAIKLTVKPDVGAGNGQVGTPGEPIYLSTFPQPIITNIGSCYTGQGNNKGHLLIFTWELQSKYDSDILPEEQLSNLKVRVVYTFITGE
jgi:hypothetical protein